MDIIILIFSGSQKEGKVAQSYLTLCDPMNCSPPGSSIHGILQARVLEWVAIPFSRGSSRPTSPTLQADSLPSELQGRSSNILPHSNVTGRMLTLIHLRHRTSPSVQTRLPHAALLQPHLLSFCPDPFLSPRQPLVCSILL